jgi:hypothetical protein
VEAGIHWAIGVAERDSHAPPKEPLNNRLIMAH